MSLHMPKNAMIEQLVVCLQKIAHGGWRGAMQLLTDPRL